MTQDYELIQKCLQEIEARLEWVESNQWKQNHFESLNKLIFEKTRISLSPLTLKRLWGKIEYNSNPSATTLDTLARFLDYKDWIDYQCSQNGKKFNLNFGYLKRKWVLIISSFVLGLSIIGFSIVKLSTLLPKKNYSDFEFSVQKLSSKVPNTVYFKYNAKNTDADSVIIQQSWDPKLHHIVDKNKTDFSCIYYYPGYYKAKLVLDKEVVSQQDLHIKSNGWLGIIHKNPIPNYLTSKDIIDGETISIKENHLLDAGFDLKHQIPYTSINLVEEFENIEGDNFELQTVFKQTYPKGEAICQKSELVIMCSEDFFYIPFSIKGCVNELRMHIPNKFLNAKNMDLRALGIEDSVVVKLKVSQGIFNLTVGQNSTIIDTLTTDPGKIVGLRFGFHGTGKVSSFNINAGNTGYSEHDFIP